MTTLYRLLLIGLLALYPAVANAAIVTRFYSTTAAGAGDGTTWADRAELDPAGAWSTVITGFDFSGADAQKACVGPGTYTVTAALASASFANPPTAANPLVFVACDGSGNPLAIPDPDWVSAQAAWSDATMPEIATTTNIITTSLVNTTWFLFKFTASGRNGAVVTGGILSWSQVINSTANTSAVAVSGPTVLYNAYVACTGSSYSSVVAGMVGMGNVRVEGVAGSSGNRHGVSGTGVAAYSSRVTIVGVGGDGVNVSSSSTSQAYRFNAFTIANVGGTCIKPNSTASQTVQYEIYNGMMTGCAVAGIDAQSAGRVVAAANRLRDNNAQNFLTLLNYPTDLNNYTTDSDDTTEYVNAAAGDYRIKNTAAIWGQGYGAGDEPAAASSGFKNFLGGQ